MQKPVLLILVTLLWVVSVVGCSSSIGPRAAQTYNRNPLTVAIPRGLTDEEVEAVMKQSLVARGWQVRQSSPQQIDGVLNHRSYNAKVSLVADDGIISILNDSQYISDNDGTTLPGVPRGWLDNLQKDLSKRLDTASHM